METSVTPHSLVNSADHDVPTRPDPALKRRALAVFGACAVADLAIILGYRAHQAGVAGAWVVLSGVVLLAPAIFIAMEPLRGRELRNTLGKEPVVVPWRARFIGVGIAVVLTLIAPYVTGTPWRVALAYFAASAVYLAIWAPLARLQQRGVKPYWRPAWYGFLIAGLTAGLVWTVTAGENPFDGIFKGAFYCMVHYAWARWTTRSAAIRQALAAPAEQSPRAT
jgi:hypothetical protein